MSAMMIASEEDFSIVADCRPIPHHEINAEISINASIEGAPRASL
jgi:hypothetical protein